MPLEKNLFYKKSFGSGGIQLQLHDRFHVDWYFIDAYSGRWVQGDGVWGQVVHFSTHTQIAQLIYHKVPTHTPSQVNLYTNIFQRRDPYEIGVSRQLKPSP